MEHRNADSVDGIGGHEYRSPAPQLFDRIRDIAAPGSEGCELLRDTQAIGRGGHDAARITRTLPAGEDAATQLGGVVFAVSLERLVAADAHGRG